MRAPLLILVSGPQGSGKTYLAERLSAELKIPLYARDVFKDLMYETMGWKGGREWLDKVGYVANENLFLIMKQELGAHRSVIIENIFHPGIYEKILGGIAKQAPFRLVQVNLRANPAVLRKRHEKRLASGEVHPAHKTSKYPKVLDDGFVEFLDLPGKRITVETTKLLKPADIKDVVGQIKPLLT